jgi:hypothetical protein
MSHYIHHVPGRLRVKSPTLKRNERHAQQTKQHIDSVPGVLASECNTVTGSLVINYDAKLVGAHTLLDSLRDLGHVHPQHAVPVAYSAGTNVTQKISDKVVNKLLETVIERSATVLIAALI